MTKTHERLAYAVAWSALAVPLICTVGYAIQSAWAGGFTANVTVTSSTTITATTPAHAAGADLRAAVVETSAQFPRGVNEMEQSGLAAAPCRLVRPPRVAVATDLIMT